MVELSASQKLQDKVIGDGLCTSCGACVGLCPYFDSYQGRTVLKDLCDLPEGRCFSFCPRTLTDLNAVTEDALGVPYSGEDLGIVLKITQARSTDVKIREKAQYGGVVTTLNCFALENGIIDSAILTYSQDKLKAKAIIATTVEKILDCAGSSYTAIPMLEAFNRGVLETNQHRIGVTGTPCQILTLAKMKKGHNGRIASVNKLGITIGLFCTWAFSYQDFIEFLTDKAGGAKIKKVDIPPPPASKFEIFTTSECISIPLDQIRKFIMPSCSYCLDMTAEFADISVGTVEGITGWNTVIIRSQKGLELFEAAVAKGSIETENLPKEKLNHLKQAAALKKKRALKNIIARSGDKNDLLYLKIEPATLKKLIEF